MKMYLKGALALSLLAATSGCASLITGGDLVRPGEPTGIIEVHNNSQSTPLDVVLISSCDASTYGLNRLPSGMSIVPGGRYRWTVSAGCWDIGAGEVLSDTEWTEGYLRTRVEAGQTITVQSR